ERPVRSEMMEQSVDMNTSLCRASLQRDFLYLNLMLMIFRPFGVRNAVECIENLLKRITFVCYSPVLDTFFFASLRKKLELTGAAMFVTS
ncbi:hypothetical protein, partial [uncultured Chryseobacterium sp.]|uniref:hypothetical protein n=1 Tax=uncultured Chryseobacterium sp. TaxID=259322 RepID=UPI0025E66ABC